MGDVLPKGKRMRTHTFDGPTPDELPIFQKRILKQLQRESASLEAAKNAAAEKLKEEQKAKRENTLAASERPAGEKDEKDIAKTEKEEPEKSGNFPENSLEAKLQELDAEQKRLQARKKELFKQLKELLAREKRQTST